MADETRTAPPRSPDATRTGPDVGVTASGPTPEPADALPERVGRFVVLGGLARGGMGVVYRAHDPAFDREVAVKVLAERLADRPEAVRRFTDEARVTGQLQHPAIPPAHEVGTLPDGRPFLAMKLIKGRTLDELLRERSDPSADRGRFVAIFEAVCQAVGYAHSRGVIHRDLKPHNVMVGAFAEVQVMDWGLAKNVAVSREAQPSADPAGVPSGITEIRTTRDSDGEKTQAGAVLGTPAFMPPEQAGGEVGKIDRRADVFGLGAVLCVILTGKPPYVGPDAEAVRLMAIRGQLADALVRLDGCGAEPELVALAKRCLSADPADRPADAGVLAKAVAAFRVGAEERAQRAELERAAAEARAVEQRKRRRVQVGLVAAVALFAAAVGGGLWQVDRERQQSEYERGQLVQQSEHEKEQLAQRGRFEQLQLVTTAVARLEGLRDLAAEKPDYAHTAQAATSVRELWERASVSLEQSAHLLDSPMAADPAAADRVARLHRDIPAGLLASDQLVDRTRRRIAKLYDARKAANDGMTMAARNRAEEAVRIDPLAAEAHLIHGDYACRRAEFKTAAASYAAGLPLARKYSPHLAADLEVRLNRATFMAGPSGRFVNNWAGEIPTDAAEACDLAEMFLVTGYFERAARVYERAFTTDPRAHPAHRATAALAATLAGCGLGKDAASLTLPRRLELRALADRWLPPLPPLDVLLDDKKLTSHAPYEGVNPARYRFVRAVLPNFAGNEAWEGIELTDGAKGRTEGVSVPGNLLIGSPYPNKRALGDGRRDGEPAETAGKFLESVLPRHLALDVAYFALWTNPMERRFALMMWAI